MKTDPPQHRPATPPGRDSGAVHEHRARELLDQRADVDTDANANADAACALIASRRNVSPRRLLAPGPSMAQCERLFTAAAAAPDHGLLLPWRLVAVPRDKRGLLSEAFALGLIARDPGATLLQIEAAREKAHRAPLLMLAVVRLMSNLDPGIPDVERLVSLGAALQNMLLAAQGMGFGAGLTSGRALQCDAIRALFALSPHEQAVCFINVGTVSTHKPGRIRPVAAQFVSSL